MTNPAFSGSVTKTLLAASPNNVFYLPLGASGMTLSTSFGGLEGVLSGSGSATGTASFNVGASANAYLGIGYHDLTTGAGWTLPSGVSFSYVPPSAYYSTFQVNRININVELVATQQFSVGYTWLYIKYIAADFTVALTGSANYAYTSSSSVAPSVAVSVVSVSPSDDDSLKVITSSPDADAADAPLELSPGDSLALSVEYENFNPGERTELFVSVHRDDDLSETGISVLQVPFTVNGAGRGSVEVRWVVPWDTKFMQRVGQAVRTDGGALLARLSVHASNQMSVRFFAPQALKLTADPHMYGMMKLPQPDEIIAVNTTYVVVWNSEGLRTFKRSVAGTSGIGSMQTVPFVNIELLYEDVNPSSGETALAGHFRLNASPEPNDRSAPVTFPRAALADVTAGCVRRFFVVVSSTVSANLMGWSEGYFHLVDSLEESPDAAVLPRIQPAGAANAQRRDGLHKADPLFHRPRGAALLGHEQAVRALPHSAPSPLSSCSSGTSVTYGSTVEGAFVSITCFTFVWPLEGYEHGFTLLNSQSCVSQPYAVEGADPVPTPSSDSSASNDQELSTAWVAGISAMATCLALAVAAVLYMRCYNAVTAHKEVDEAGQIDLPCPDATKATQAQELATEAAIANPLSTATEV